eukprot:COSAG01_NODE_794_length_13545_cov_7.323070_4_plen_178_part_00
MAASRRRSLTPAAVLCAVLLCLLNAMHLRIVARLRCWDDMHRCTVGRHRQIRQADAQPAETQRDRETAARETPGPRRNRGTSDGMVRALCTALAALLLPATAAAEGKKWVLLVAGSNTYGNYRHQSDICHAYRLVTEKGGIPAENVVTFMYHLRGISIMRGITLDWLNIVNVARRLC